MTNSNWQNLVLGDGGPCPDPEDLIADAAWLLPQLGPALARLRVEWREAKPTDPSTAMVNKDGVIVLTTAIQREDIMFILLHEIMHMVSHFFVSSKGLSEDDWWRWLKASDRWINAVLSDILKGNLTGVPKDALLPKADQWDWTIEQLYAVEAKERRPKRVKAGQGCGGEMGKPGEGEEAEAEGEGDGGSGLDEVTARQIAAGIGSVVGRFADIIVTPPPRALRRDILREAAASASGYGKPKSSFTRLGRRSNPQVPRPGKVRRRPRVVVVVDVSGSMYPDLPEIVAEAEDLAGIAEVHLILHDTEVLHSGKAHKSALKKAIQHGGGTSFGPALREAGKVAKAMGGGCAVVHFTDGYCGDPWPEPEVPPSFVGMTADSQAQAPRGWRVRKLKGKVV